MLLFLVLGMILIPSERVSRYCEAYNGALHNDSFFLFFSNFLHVSGRLLPFKGQPDLLSHLRDPSPIFGGFGDDFDTHGKSLEPIIGLDRMIGKSLEIDLISWIR